MTYPLAVYSPHIGAWSESFIRRFMNDLLPGRTVLLANGVRAGANASQWNVEVPSLLYEKLRPIGLKRQVLLALAWQLGWEPPDRMKSETKKFLLAHGVQVLLSNYLDLSLPFLEIARELGIRFVAHGHGYDVSQTLKDPRWQEEYLKFNQADAVVVVSAFIRRRLIALGLDPGRIHVIPPGTDVPAQPVFRPQRDVVRCLVLGRMGGTKSPILTLDAFRRAAEVVPNLVLDYVGMGSDFRAAQDFVTAFHLQQKVTLHGNQPDAVVQRMKQDADIFVLHYLTDPVDGCEEGLPVTLAEMMAQSLPIVATRHVGIPEAVADGVQGWLVEEGDSVGMAERIVALAQDGATRRRMGLAGWERARAEFSWELERQRLLEVMGLE